MGSQDNDVWGSAMRETSLTGHIRRTENNRGLAEAARLWAREKGLPVAAHGEVPPTIIRQYRQRTAAS